MRDFINAQIEGHARSIALQALPAPLELNQDVEERPAWGLDCYTYRYTCDLDSEEQLDARSLRFQNKLAATNRERPMLA